MISLAHYTEWTLKFSKSFKKALEVLQNSEARSPKGASGLPCVYVHAWSRQVFLCLWLGVCIEMLQIPYF